MMSIRMPLMLRRRATCSLPIAGAGNSRKTPFASEQREFGKTWQITLGSITGGMAGCAVIERSPAVAPTMILRPLIGALFGALITSPLAAQPIAGQHSFTIGQKDFLLDGQPFVI